MISACVMKKKALTQMENQMAKTLEFCGGKVTIYLYIFRGGGEKSEKKGLFFDS